MVAIFTFISNSNMGRVIDWFVLRIELNDCESLLNFLVTDAVSVQRKFTLAPKLQENCCN